jgi:hypothetical protein
MLSNFYEINEQGRDRIAQLQHEAEKEHRAQLANSRNMIIRPLLAKVGRQMGRLGHHLEERYGAEAINGLAQQS